MRVQLAGTNYLTLSEVEVFGAATPATSGADVRWLVSDQLGTPRMVADETGSLAGVTRHDYLPFGEELGAGTGGRATSQGYGGDSLRQKWAKLENDSETGLSYAKARYYARAQGRFTSVDPAMGSAKPAIPQSWNRYAYCLNMPLLYIDPTGMIWGYRDFEKDGKQWREYRWFAGDNVGKDYKTVTKFYDELEINGKMVGVRLNPEGPYSLLKTALIAITAAKFIYYSSDFYVKGYEYTRTNAEIATFLRTGTVYSDFGTQFALTGAGLALGGKVASSFGSGPAPLSISTPYGTAVQSTAPGALAAREAIEGGATLYRGGILGRSAAAEGQFWSLQHPLSAGYAQRHGLPPGNVSFDFIEYGTLKPGHPFITRPAPGVGANAGGGIEAVVNPSSVRLQGFSQP